MDNLTKQKKNWILINLNLRLKSRYKLSAKELILDDHPKRRFSWDSNDLQIPAYAYDEKLRRDNIVRKGYLCYTPQ